MERPIINIRREPIDWVLEVMGITSVFILLLYPLMQYSDLPDTIPIHFGASGKADGWGSKRFIWLLPIMGTLMYIGLTWLSNYPHKFNYIKKITSENAYFQYRNSIKLMRFLKVFISVVFCYLTYRIIDGASGDQSDLGPLFIPVFLVLIFGGIGYFLYKSGK